MGRVGNRAISADHGHEWGPARDELEFIGRPLRRRMRLLRRRSPLGESADDKGREKQQPGLDRSGVVDGDLDGSR